MRYKGGRGATIPAHRLAAAVARPVTIIRLRSDGYLFMHMSADYRRVCVCVCPCGCVLAYACLCTAANDVQRLKQGHHGDYARACFCACACVCVCVCACVHFIRRPADWPAGCPVTGASELRPRRTTSRSLHILYIKSNFFSSPCIFFLVQSFVFW